LEAVVTHSQPRSAPPVAALDGDRALQSTFISYEGMKTGASILRKSYWEYAIVRAAVFHYRRNARASCALFIRDRPGMFRRIACR
jgi:hypothetical protein